MSFHSTEQSYTPRGVVRSEERARQLLRFDGMEFGTITPTDIDGLIEYRNKCYVFYEAKYNGSGIPCGQRLAIERICNDLQKTKPAIALLVTHESDGDIYLADTLVEAWYHKGEWHLEGRTHNAKEFTDSFINHIDKNFL